MTRSAAPSGTAVSVLSTRRRSHRPAPWRPAGAARRPARTGARRARRADCSGPAGCGRHPGRRESSTASFGCRRSGATAPARRPRRRSGVRGRLRAPSPPAPVMDSPVRGSTRGNRRFVVVLVVVDVVITMAVVVLAVADVDVDIDVDVIVVTARAQRVPRSSGREGGRRRRGRTPLRRPFRVERSRSRDPRWPASTSTAMSTTTSRCARGPSSTSASSRPATALCPGTRGSGVGRPPARGPRGRGARPPSRRSSNSEEVVESRLHEIVHTNPVGTNGSTRATRSTAGPAAPHPG